MPSPREASEAGVDWTMTAVTDRAMSGMTFNFGRLAICGDLSYRRCVISVDWIENDL